MMFRSYRNSFRSRRCSSAAVLAFCLISLAAIAPESPAATEKVREKIVASPQITDQELVAVRALFERLGAAFLTADAEAAIDLFTPESRQRVSKNLTSEFQQSRYLHFQILQILPDDTLRENVHTVDVRFRFVVVEQNWAPELQQPLADYIRAEINGSEHSPNSSSRNLDDILKSFSKANALHERTPALAEPNANITSHNFVIQKTSTGQFLIRNSSFFDSLGLRQGMGLVVEGLLAAMIISALLAFWVWMGWEALRARPKYRFWRWIVLFPVVGACAFFVAAYLPRQWKERSG